MEEQKKLTFSSIPRFYFLPLIVAVVLISLFLLTVRPQLERIGRLKKEVAGQKERLKKLTEKSSLLESTSKDELQRKVLKVEQVLPSEKPAVRIINTLSQLSSEGEVIFSGIDLSPGELSTLSAKAAQKKQAASKTNLAPFLKVGFSIDGTKDKVFSFLDSLEMVTPIMRIEALKLSIIEGVDFQETIMNAGIDISVFYQQAPTELGKIETSLPLLTPEETEILADLDNFKLFAEFKGSTQNLGKENLFEF